MNTQYNHTASQQHLQNIMRSDYNDTRMSEEAQIPEKVDIIEALESIKTAYAKAGRSVPSYSDSMALVALANS